MSGSSELGLGTRIRTVYAHSGEGKHQSLLSPGTTIAAAKSFPFRAGWMTVAISIMARITSSVREAEALGVPGPAAGPAGVWAERTISHIKQSARKPIRDRMLATDRVGCRLRAPITTA